MGSVFAWAARLHDACIGRCVTCGVRSRRFECESCRKSAALAWDVAGVPAWSAASYAGVVGDRIRRLKYHDETHWAGPLGRLLHARMSTRIDPHLILVPVPLHPARLAERGYNQSALIARSAARAGAWRVETDVLLRQKSTAPQALQDANKRKTNVADAFEVARTPDAAVVLVDDVATTGSTLAECVLCLGRAGVIVRSVMTVALAGKAPGDHGCVF